jgi:hypothetical protein
MALGLYGVRVVGFEVLRGLGLEFEIRCRLALRLGFLVRLKL